MRVSFEASFARDLKGIKDRALLRRLEQVIQEAKTARALNEIKHLARMRSEAGFYRIRLGDYRVGIEVVGDHVIFVRILHRKDIYRYFP